MEVVQIPASCGKAADLPTLCSLVTDFQGCLTSQMLPEFGEDFSTRGGEIRPLSWGPGHRRAVLFCFFGSWPGMLIAGREEWQRIPRLRVC